MSFDSSIIAHFGGDTTGLQSATDEASIMMKGFSTGASRAVREIGQGFVGAVVFMEAIKGIKELSAAAIDAAEQERNTSMITGQAISDQGQAWLDLKDGAESTGSMFKSVGMTLVSVFPMAGEAIGTLINDMRGISPASQAQFTEMAAVAEYNLNKIKAAHDKFFEELPAKQAAANAKLSALDEQLVGDQISSGAKVLDLMAQQGPLLQAISDTEAEIAVQRAAGRDTSAAQLALTNQEAALDQNKLAIEKAQLDVARDYVTSATEDFETKRETMTIEEQIAALKAQQLQYQQQESLYADNAKATELLKAAAARDGKQIAQDTLEIKKATALSEADELAMYVKETPALANLNTLSDEQYQSLKLQSQEKQNQYAIDQLLSLGIDNLNASQKALLNTLVQQSSELSKQIGFIQDQADAEKQLAAQAAAVAAATAAATDAATNAAKDTKARGGNVNGIDQAGMILSKDASGKPILLSGDPNKGNAVYAAETDDGSWGAGMMGTPIYNPGLTGVGYGNAQLQAKYTQANESSFMNSEIKALSSRLMGMENADLPGSGSSIAALQTQLEQLNQKMQAIHDGVVPAFTGH